MPAILRILLPKRIALTPEYTSYAQDDVVMGSGGPDRPPCGPWQRHGDLQHDEVLSVWVRWGGHGLRPSLTEISITDVLGIA